MTENAWGAQTQFFYSLTQDHVLNAIDELGFRTTGRCLPLNSMENRVYELEIECENPTSASDNFVVAKFYRPGRWNRAQIKQEHQFLFDLANAEIPVIAPKMFDSESLFQMDSGLFYCVFPKKGGRLLDEMNEDQVAKLGRTLARMHNIGSMHPAPDRIKISPETYGDSNIAFLETSENLPTQFRELYIPMAKQCVELMRPHFNHLKTGRIHGDCHWGNIISRDEEMYLIDFDDMLIGPAIQDIWLALPGRDSQAQADREVLLRNYESMREFDRRELKLIEPLRTLRFIHFTAWIAKRYEDPAFQRAFPHFKGEHYWQTQIQDLREQYALMMEVLSQGYY